MKVVIYFSFAMTILFFSLMSRVLFSRYLLFDRFFALVFIGFVSLLAYLFSFGTDYPIYNNHYNNIVSSGLLNVFDVNGGWWEPGFAYFAGLFGWVGFGYDVFVCFCVFVSLFLCLYGVKEFTRNSLFFFFTLFCFCFMFLPFIRQDLAASLIFLSFVSFFRRRYFLYFFLVVLAFFVHKSSIIPAVFVVFSLPRFFDFFVLFVRKNLLVLLVFSIILFSYVGQLDSQRIALQLSVYGSDDFVQGVLDQQTSLIRNYLKFVFYVGFVFLLWRTLPVALRRAEEGVSAWCIRYVVMFSFVCVLLIAVSPIFSRLSIYLFPFISLAFSVWFDSIRFGKQFYLFFYFVLVVLVFVNMYIVLYPMLDWM